MEKLLINNPKSSNSDVMRNKQIEEMAQIVCGDTRCKNCVHRVEVEDCAATKTAKHLYNAGYRKQEWFSVKTDPPKKSGYYLCCVGGEFPMVIHYSAKHRAFNAYDEFEETSCPIEVTHWMPLLEQPHE